MSGGTTCVLAFRDGYTVKDPRGFNMAGGVVGRGLRWPLPPTTAGAVRTSVGTALGWLAPGVCADWPRLLTEVGVAGPLAVVRTHSPTPGAWRAVFPCPRDLVALPQDPQTPKPEAKDLRLRWLAPVPPPGGGAEGEVCGSWGTDAKSAATEALWRPCLREKAKPLDLPSWWKEDEALAWLLDPRGFEQRCRSPAPVWCPDARQNTRQDMHLAIEPKRGTASPSLLYGLETQETFWRHDGGMDELGVWLRILHHQHSPLSTWCRLGGESRWATIATASPDPFGFPKERYASYIGEHHPTRIRLLLMTPAVFKDGWLPDSFKLATDRLFHGSLHGLSHVDFSLRAAFVPRAGAVSGWDFQKRAPKSSRLFVPVGAVYYLEASRALELEDLEALWLTTLQGVDTQDARDGFGLVVPGLWPDAN